MTDGGPPPKATPLDDWLECLALEREAEREECDAIADSLPPRELERRGIAIHRLKVASTETVLFGRAQLTLPRQLLLKREHLLVRCEVFLAVALIPGRHAFNHFMHLEVTLRSELLLAPQLR